MSVGDMIITKDDRMGVDGGACGKDIDFIDIKALTRSRIKMDEVEKIYIVNFMTEATTRGLMSSEANVIKKLINAHFGHYIRNMKDSQKIIDGGSYFPEYLKNYFDRMNEKT